MCFYAFFTSLLFKVKFEIFQSFNERLAQLKQMSDRFDTIRVQRADDITRSWDEVQSRIRKFIVFVLFLPACIWINAKSKALSYLIC